MKLLKWNEFKESSSLEEKKAQCKSYKKSGLEHPEKADLNKDKKINTYEKKRGLGIEGAIRLAKEKMKKSK
jgi:hypothetical protein